MFFEDLSDYTYYLRKPLSCVKNVGWLDASHAAVRVGTMHAGFLPKLEKIIVSRGRVDVHVNQIRGVHPCAVSNSCEPVVIGDGRVGLGSSEIWIPSGDGTHYFAAPSLIYHYVRDHNYLPPPEFVDAVEKMSLQEPFSAQARYLELVEGHF